MNVWSGQDLLQSRITKAFKNYTQEKNSLKIDDFRSGRWQGGLYNTKNARKNGAFVATSNQNHRIIHLFNIIEILNKFKIFKYHRIRKFSNLDVFVYKA